MAEHRTIRVEGMTCTGCEQRVSGRVRELDGVRDVTADHQTGEVRVSFDPASLSQEAIAGRIRDIGYTVAT
jgi:copper chaperone